MAKNTVPRTQYETPSFSARDFPRIFFIMQPSQRVHQAARGSSFISCWAARDAIVKYVPENTYFEPQIVWPTLCLTDLTVSVWNHLPMQIQLLLHQIMNSFQDEIEMNNYAGSNSDNQVNDQDVQNLQNLMNFLMKSRSWNSFKKRLSFVSAFFCSTGGEHNHSTVRSGDSWSCLLTCKAMYNGSVSSRSH